MHRSRTMLFAALAIAACGISLSEMPVKNANPFEGRGPSGRMKGRGNSHMAPPERNRHKKKKWHGTPAGH
jgi:hypothetical protein